MLPFATLRTLAQRALDEDLNSGDLTTEATIDPGAHAEARFIAKSELVVSGYAIAEACFLALDPELQMVALSAEGARVPSGSVIWTVRGRTRSILQAERCALNFAQRMSGISTLTRAFVEAVPAGCKARIADTRKTTPGLRALERYAVRIGGGYNHRDNLGSAVLIKDNHIAAAGSVAIAVARARERAPHTSKIEVEVESLAMLDEAIAAGAEIIMLDNFAPHEIAGAVARVAGRALVEVSGGVGLSRVAELARAGVDVISIGALTHSAPAADISLRLA